MWAMLDKVQNDDVNILIRQHQKLERLQRFSPMSNFKELCYALLPKPFFIECFPLSCCLFETKHVNIAYMFDCWSIKSCDRRLLNSRKVTFTQILYETKLRFVFFWWILVRRSTEKKVFVFVNSRTLTQLNCPKQRDVLLRLFTIFTPTSAICCSPTNVWCQVRAVSCYTAALAACVTV